jgi:hypothetical protein
MNWNGFFRSLAMGRLVGVVLIFVAAAGFAAFTAVDNAINYTEVQARVERVGIVCRSKGAPAEAAVDCTRAELAAPVDGKSKLIRQMAVYVRYTSPGDGKEHQGRLLVGGKRLTKVRTLRPGDSWTIWAHDDKPEAIKVY